MGKTSTLDACSDKLLWNNCIRIAARLASAQPGEFSSREIRQMGRDLRDCLLELQMRGVQLQLQLTES